MYKALCFLDDEQGRDVELLLPLIYHAERYLGCDVKFVFVWDIFAVYREMPDIVILPNTVGSKWYFEVAKYAYDQNITVFALISEGNFRTNGTFDYWGYNTEKKYFQDYVCHWSQRTKDFLIKELPECSDQMVVTGATGFDRYKIYQFPSKVEFLEQKGMTSYKRVIGYAGWAFGKIYSDIGRQEIVAAHKELAGERMAWMEKQMYAVEQVLLQLIENNKDTLFILKVHPNETHPHITHENPNEIIRLRDYPNVLYVKNEESIQNLIAVSDIWMGFETTTAIEAWMLGKETILINPDPNFARDYAHAGSIIAKSYDEAQGYVDEFYKKNSVGEFNSVEKQAIRKGIIADTIGFDDGLNHLRAAFYLKESLMNSPRRARKRKFVFRFFLRSLSQKVGTLIYIRSLFLKLPKFKKTIWIFDRCKLKNLDVLKSRYYPYLDEFYRRKGLINKSEQEIFWRNQIEEANNSKLI